ncbi:acyl-CoA thioesterase [Zunongwangia pacifica]|uniref:Acyl-CoA thioester hydrolase n=1 Tax=Zunongwangia pacifica TaxID=2911062 RepID=A0A9X2CQX8_9FLAO|nr:thioesterase family protein [Zunongwangia pacifica]MCL6220487.1 hypothetical protein [Zunongwangia pacifica]
MLKNIKGRCWFLPIAIFKKALQYPGNAIIKTRIAEVGNKSFKIEHHIFDDQNQLCAVGQDVSVFYDFTANKTLPISNDLREILGQY